MPSQWFGMSSDHVASIGAFDADFVRSWGYNGDGSGGSSFPGVQVRTVNTSSGVFDWSQFDLMFSSNTGKKVMVCLGIPADWMITRSAVGGATYGGKSNMVPTGATEINNYLGCVTAMVERARDTHGQIGLVWELWNEFDDSALMGEGISAFVAHAKAVYQAIKAIDSTATVLSPSITQPSQTTLFAQFFSTSDGSGGYGGDWCDGASFHFYDVWSSDTALGYWVGVQQVRRAMGSYSELPLYVTESGFFASQFESRDLRRRMLAFAALGIQHFVGYSLDFVVNPMLPFADEYNEMAGLLRGATVGNIRAWPDGAVSVDVDGVTVKI